jgi:hypothetical protein
MSVLNAAIENSKLDAAKKMDEIIAKATQEKIRLQEKFGTAVKA